MTDFASKEWQERIRIAMLAEIADAERDLTPEQRKKNAAERERVNAESERAKIEDAAMTEALKTVDMGDVFPEDER